MLERIKEFLSDPVFNEAGVMRKAGVNKSYWSQMKNGTQPFKKSHQDAIISVITQYGFKVDQ